MPRDLLPVLVVLAAAVGIAIGPALAGLATRSLRAPHRPDRRLLIGVSSVTGLLFCLVVLRFGTDPAAVGELAFVAAGTTLSIVDLKEKRLPNAIVLPTGVIVIGLLVAASVVMRAPGAAVSTVVGAAALFGLLLLLAVASRGQLGMGDVKFGLAAGAATGVLGLHPWLIGLVVAVLLNGAAAVVALALRRTTLRGTLPFGPCIFLGAVVAVVLAPV